MPGQLDNYNFNCGADGGGSAAAACNNDVSLALGFSYNVPVGSEALLTFTLSNTAPSGAFYLSQTKPLDGDNDPETVYFSGNLAIQALQAVPEPSSLVLLVAGALAAGGVIRRGRITRFDMTSQEVAKSSNSGSC